MEGTQNRRKNAVFVKKTPLKEKFRNFATKDARGQ